MTASSSDISLISIMNRIQDSFMSLKLRNPLDLPQIVVVGGQSAGKSSVLEAIVGKDFLPRGAGICTRRPLVLQLINTAPGTKEYGEFAHLKSQKFFDFHEVRDEIENETDRLTGKNKGIAYDPITLRIHSPHVLDLTLVDLPGITKVSIGDQPPNIEKQIRKMILHYISNKKCLILAVTPANSDLANSDAVKIAKRVDLEGLRTFNVITKLDLMDEGTDAREILENKFLKRPHGYIGVVNRSQQEINQAKCMKDAVTAEKEFFDNHPSYRHMADRMGTEYLKKTLHSELISHIRQSLPGLRDTLQKMSMDMDIEKEEYQHFDASDTASLMRMMNEMVHNLHSDFKSSFFGGHATSISTTERSVGTEIRELFNEKLLEDVNNIPYDNDEIEEQIEIAIANVHGIKSGVFTPDTAFEVIVKSEIAKLKQPIMKCVDSVANRMANVVTTCTKRMESFPKLQLYVERRVSELLRENQKKCRNQLALILDIELMYMNTKHPDFDRLAIRQSKMISRISDDKTNEAESPDDVVLARGHLSVDGEFVWCVLRNNTLYAYTDDINEKDERFFLSITSVEIENRGFFQKVFKVVFSNSNATWENSPIIQIDCDEEDFFRWKAAFTSAGILVEESLAVKRELERQIEEIHSFAGFYFRIVMKKMIDTTPKVIVMLLVNSCEKYIKNDLFTYLHLSGQMAELMSETEDARQKREDFLKMYEACNESLHIIDEVHKDIISKNVVSNMVQLETIVEPPVATSNGCPGDDVDDVSASDSGFLSRLMRRSVNID